MMREGFWLQAGAVWGFLAVAMGAFGAHGLKAHVTDERRLDAWKTASMYQLIHSAALLALTAKHKPTAYCFVGGMGLFSGSLYAMALGAPRWMGAVTPFGGMLFLTGWLILAWSARGVDPAG